MEVEEGSGSGVTISTEESDGMAGSRGDQNHLPGLRVGLATAALPLHVHSPLLQRRRGEVEQSDLEKEAEASVKDR